MFLICSNVWLGCNGGGGGGCCSDGGCMNGGISTPNFQSIDNGLMVIKCGKRTERERTM